MLLHVTNGHSALHLIERSGLPGRSMVWCDPLYEGPVPGDISDNDLVRVRAEFLASSPDAVDDVVADLAGWRAAIDDRASYDELVLWFEHDLFDQLNLIQLLSHIGPRLPLLQPVTLICIDRHGGHPDFKGLGELTPREIAALFPSRVRVTGEHIAVAERAWRSFRSRDPHDIEAFLSTPATPLSFLADALRRHLEEFPHQSDGLSRSERRLMHLLVDGPADLPDLLPLMHEGERAYYVTDTMLLDRVRGLASGRTPLLTVRERDHTRAPSGTVALTEAGRAVLNGERDRIGLAGIDRWLGGVHLTGNGPVWRWTGTGVRWQQ